MAGVNDWISLDEGKSAVNLTGTSFDQELALYISAVSQRLDDYDGAAVIRTITSEAHDAGSPPATSVLLDYRPINTVTSVVEYDLTVAQTLAAETNAAKTANDYVVDLKMGRIRRRNQGYDAYFPAGRGNVVVTYTAGRYAATANVPERRKLAAGIYLTHLWRHEQGAGTVTFGGVDAEGLTIPTFGIPNVVRDLLTETMDSPLVG